jgi:hypothetical protein
MLKMTQEEAQKVLDKRNENFQIISYNGMRNNSEVICLHCGSQFSTSIDSLLRKSGTSFGCSYCNFQRIKDKLQNNSLEFISRNKDKTINVKCKNYNHIITNRASILTNPNLRGLYDFIKINSIPAMKRKWNRLEVLSV